MPDIWHTIVFKMSDALGLISALSSAVTSASYITAFNVITSSSATKSESFSCGLFSYAIIYIQTCGGSNSADKPSFISNLYLIITPNTDHVNIYTMASSSDIRYGIGTAEISSTSSIITIKLTNSYSFINGSILAFS